MNNKMSTAKGLVNATPTEENQYTLLELVDLSLRVPQRGCVNFNILHTVLTTMISELRLQKVRPWCHVENEQLARARLAKFKLQDEELRKIRSEEAVRHEQAILAPLRRVSSTMSAERKIELDDTSENANGAPPTEETDQTAGESDQTTSDQAAKGTEETPTKVDEQPERLEAPKELERRVAAGWDNVKRDLLEPPKRGFRGPSEPIGGSRRIGPMEDAWRYTHLRSKVDTNQEGLMRLTEIVDMIADKIKKAEDRRKQGGGASIEELEGLEERVGDLEEARQVFEVDHVSLEKVGKVQNQMLEEFEDVKALGSQIKQIKVDLSSKAGTSEMESALALKGDLALVNTKVDQLEFETAIQELGEAIGLLGLKFQRKCDEWEARAEEIWKAIRGKMSRDVFDAAMEAVESRLQALTFGLTNLKRVVDEHVAPEASGAYRCISCRRPAEVSGKHCTDAKVPKRPLKTSETSSEDSQETESIPMTIKDVRKKKPKLKSPPYPDKMDITLSLPDRGAIYRSSQDGAHLKTKSDMRIHPIDESRGDDRKASIPKLPNIQSKDATRSSLRSNASKYSVPKNSRNFQHKELVFTDRVLERMKRERTEEERQLSPVEEFGSELGGSKYEPNGSSNISSVDTYKTSSKDIRSESDSMGVMTDSGKNVKSFAPVRRGSLQKISGSQKPKLILSPLSTNASSSDSLETKDSS